MARLRRFRSLESSEKYKTTEAEIKRNKRGGGGHLVTIEKGQGLNTRKRARMEEEETTGARIREEK